MLKSILEILANSSERGQKASDALTVKQLAKTCMHFSQSPQSEQFDPCPILYFQHRRWRQTPRGRASPRDATSVPPRRCPPRGTESEIPFRLRYNRSRSRATSQMTSSAQKPPLCRCEIWKAPGGRRRTMPRSGSWHRLRQCRKPYWALGALCGLFSVTLGVVGVAQTGVVAQARPVLEAVRVVNVLRLAEEVIGCPQTEPGRRPHTRSCMTRSKVCDERFRLAVDARSG